MFEGPGGALKCALAMFFKPVMYWRKGAFFSGFYEINAFWDGSRFPGFGLREKEI